MNRMMLTEAQHIVVACGLSTYLVDPMDPGSFSEGNNGDSPAVADLVGYLLKAQRRLQE